MAQKKSKDLFDLAFEKALFDNAHMHFDIRLQDPDLRAKFRELLDLYVQKFCSKTLSGARRRIGKNSKKHP